MKVVLSGTRSRMAMLCAIVLSLSLSALPAWGQTPTLAQTPTPAALAAATTQPATVWTRSQLLGDMNGFRPALERRGMTLSVNETSEVLINISGGLERGGNYQGLTTVTWGLDTKQAGLWTGGSINVSLLQIHGDEFSPEHLGSLQTASGIEAPSQTRLWEAWFEQKMPGGKVDVRLGQQSIDQEFMSSQYSATFVETMFGWPAVPSYDMVDGGPAYPLSGLGARARAQVSKDLTLLTGVFAGNPAGDHGTDFSLDGGVLFLGELQYGGRPGFRRPREPRHRLPGVAAPSGADRGGLPGTYKIGMWYASADFADQYIDDGGLSLANPTSDGRPLMHGGNYSVYAVADQMIWQAAAGSPRAFDIFSRIMGAPGDRNLVSFSGNFGITMTAPLAGRDHDVVGLAVGGVTVGSHVRDLDRDTGCSTATPRTPCVEWRRWSKPLINITPRRGGSCKASCNTP